MHPVAQGLGHGLITARTVNRRPVRPDTLYNASGTFILIDRVLDQLAPRGVVDGHNEHPGRSSFDVQILESNVRKSKGRIPPLKTREARRQ